MFFLGPEMCCPQTEQTDKQVETLRLPLKEKAPTARERHVERRGTWFWEPQLSDCYVNTDVSMWGPWQMAHHERKMNTKEPLCVQTDCGQLSVCLRSTNLHLFKLASNLFSSSTNQKNQWPAASYIYFRPACSNHWNTTEMSKFQRVYRHRKCPWEQWHGYKGTEIICDNSGL